MLGDMSFPRMDNVGVVVEDLDAATAFFVELGMRVEGSTSVEGPWVDQVVGLEDVRCEIVMVSTPDGHGRLELTRFHTPPARHTDPPAAPANAFGLRRVMFEVEDIDATIARLRTHGAELVGTVSEYEDVYRLCYMRGPATVGNILVGLAQRL